jgi:hypothetical protein
LSTDSTSSNLLFLVYPYQVPFRSLFSDHTRVCTPPRKALKARSTCASETMNDSPNCHDDVLCVEESEVTAGNCSGRTQGLDDRGRIMLQLPVLKPPGDFFLPMNVPPELYYSEGKVDPMPPNDGASLPIRGFQHVPKCKRTNSSRRIHAGHQATIDNGTPLNRSARRRDKKSGQK